MTLPESYIVAIDGPAGSGKSTLARLLAHAIGGVVIDTGAMYRSVTAAALARGIDPADESAVTAVAREIDIRFEPDGAGQKVFVDGTDLTGRIREMEVSGHVSTVAAFPGVRERMVALQRELAARGRVVMEGRDIGTNVFPDADRKFFLVADDSVRAERRLAELAAAGTDASHDEVLANVRERDRIDSCRTHAPLRQAADAVRIDTSSLTIDGVYAEMVKNIPFKVVNENP